MKSDAAIILNDVSMSGIMMKTTPFSIRNMHPCIYHTKYAGAINDINFGSLYLTNIIDKAIIQGNKTIPNVFKNQFELRYMLVDDLDKSGIVEKLKSLVDIAESAMSISGLSNDDMNNISNYSKYLTRGIRAINSEWEKEKC